MKKVLIASLCLLSLILIVSYGCAESDWSGTWYAFKYVKNHQEYDPVEKGYYKVVAFYPTDSKTYVIDGSGNYREGKWNGSDDHVLVMYTSSSTLFFVEGDFLTETVDGGTLWYKKETDMKVPNNLNGISEDDFYGIWKLNRVYSNNFWFSLRMLEANGVKASGQVTISKESADIEIDLGNNPIYWNGLPYFVDDKMRLSNAIFIMTDTEEIYLESNGNKYLFRKIKPEDGWFCKQCGNLANGNYCSNCGQAHNSQENNLTANNGVQELENLILYRGEYEIGSDFEPGIYILEVKTMEYDALWENNKAIFKVFEYNNASKTWVQNESESGTKKGQRFKVTLKDGQKIKITMGSFEVCVYQAEPIIVEGQTENSNTPWGNTLYCGEYLIGVDLLPGSYVLAAKEFVYDQIWEYNKAAISIYEYNDSERKWKRKDYESVRQGTQKIKITMGLGQKLVVDTGVFEITEFAYQEPINLETTDHEDSLLFDSVPWMEYGVGSKLPKPFGVSGAALNTKYTGIKNSDISFEAILNGTKKDYDYYVETLKSWGFDYVLEESEYFSISIFKAKNQEGYVIELQYNPFVGIDIDAHAPDESP